MPKETEQLLRVTCKSRCSVQEGNAVEVEGLETEFVELSAGQDAAARGGVRCHCQKPG